MNREGRFRFVSVRVKRQECAHFASGLLSPGGIQNEFLHANSDEEGVSSENTRRNQQHTPLFCKLGGVGESVNDHRLCTRTKACFALHLLIFSQIINQVEHAMRLLLLILQEQVRSQGERKRNQTRVLLHANTVTSLQEQLEYGLHLFSSEGSAPLQPPDWIVLRRH